METQDRTWQNSLFWAAFLLLSVFVWCPLGYGRYGEPTLTYGMPTWAVIALAIGALLFVVEWVYLFKSGLALNDDSLTDIMEQLDAFAADEAQK